MLRMGLSFILEALLATTFATASAAPMVEAPDPIAPPSTQESADCARPTYATDQLVCADPELKALDQALADLLKKVAAQSNLVKQPWLEDQEAWVRRRSLCAFSDDHRGCVRDAYLTRIAELRARFDSRVGWTTVHCAALPQAAKYFVADQGLLTIVDDAGVVIISAWPESPSAWTPFATYRKKTRSLVLARQDSGAVLTCQ